jgi:hypothetical protein
MCSGFVGTRKVIVGNYFRLSAFDISTMVVSLGMHTQGNLPKPEPQNDAQMTRRVTRGLALSTTQVTMTRQK